MSYLGQTANALELERLKALFVAASVRQRRQLQERITHYERLVEIERRLVPPQDQK
jgi:hypothetical protein